MRRGFEEAVFVSGVQCLENGFPRIQKGGAFLESIQRYWKRTDKMYLLLCLFSSAMAVLALSSWAAKQGSGFAVDELTGQLTGIGDYRRAVVQAGAAAIGILVAVLNLLLVRSGREEQAMMTTLAGLIVVLMMLVQQISDLFQLVKTLFGL